MATHNTNKVALVTGAARRIGRCIAETLHSQGYNVVAHYHHSAAEADSLLQKLNAARPNSACSIHANLCDKVSVEQLAQQSIQHWGRLDLLVNNASSYYPTPLEDFHSDQFEQHWQDLLASNLQAPLLLSKACAASLISGNGNIINIIDSNVLAKPIAEHPIYNAAKSGLHGLTLSLAKDLAPRVRVNGVAPGAIMWAPNERDPAEQQAIVEATALGRLGSADDIAQAVLYLAEASYVTGFVMKVDGGKNIR